jgi:hypothetical protein
VGYSQDPFRKTGQDDCSRGQPAPRVRSNCTLRFGKDSRASAPGRAAAPIESCDRMARVHMNASRSVCSEIIAVCITCRPGIFSFASFPGRTIRIPPEGRRPSRSASCREVDFCTRFARSACWACFIEAINFRGLSWSQLQQMCTMGLGKRTSGSTKGVICRGCAASSSFDYFRSFHCVGAYIPIPL